MDLYLLLVMLLWIPATYEVVTNRPSPVGLAGACLVGFWFAALRFQTGHDWPGYESVFEAIPPLLDTDLLHLQALALEFGQESAFLVFMSLIKTVVRDFQAVIIVVAAILSYGLFDFLRRHARYPATTFAVCFSWLLFTLYFSTLRQALCVVMFLFFMTAFFQRRYVLAALFAGVGVSMQLSGVVYLGIFLLATCWRNRTTMWIVLALALWISFRSIEVLDLCRRILEWVGFDGEAKKIAWYTYKREHNPHWSDRVRVYVSAVFFMLVLGDFYVKNNGIWKRLAGMGIWLCVIEVLFIEFAVVRNRVFYLVFPLQVLVLFNGLSRQVVSWRIVVAVGVFLVSTTYVVLMLERASNQDFVPYQFWPYHEVTGDPGTGFERREAVKEWALLSDK